MTDYHPMDRGRTEIHPAFRWTWIGLKIGLILSWLAVGLCIVGAVTAILLGGEERLLTWILMALVLPVVAPLWYLAWFIRNRAMDRVLRASQVLRREQPRRMTMKALSAVDLTGQYVELRAEGVSENSPPWGLAVVGANRRNALPKTLQTVNVFLDSIGRDRFLVIESEKGIHYGRVTDADSREKARKNFLRFLAAMTALLMGVVGVMIYVQNLEIEEAAFELELAGQSRNWPTAEGEITASAVTGVRISRGKGSVPGFRADVEYEYYLDGRTFDGRRIFFGYKPTRDRRPADELIDRYPAGSPIRAAYDPDRPEVSVLEPGHEDECREGLEKARIAQRVTIFGALAGITVMLLVGVFWVRRLKKITGDA